MTNSSDEVMWEQMALPVQGDEDGVWCVVCGGFLPADEYGVVVHDPVPHPITMLIYDEDEVLH